MSVEITTKGSALQGVPQFTYAGLRGLRLLPHPQKLSSAQRAVCAREASGGQPILKASPLAGETARNFERFGGPVALQGHRFVRGPLDPLRMNDVVAGALIAGGVAVVGNVVTFAVAMTSRRADQERRRDEYREDDRRVRRDATHAC